MRKKDFRIVNKMEHVFIFGTIPKKMLAVNPTFIQSELISKY